MKSSEVQYFAEEFGFSTFSCSPQYDRANGTVVAGVKLAKALLKINKNKSELALLAVRNTPLENGFSTAEPLYGRIDNVGTFNSSKFKIKGLPGRFSFNGRDI